MPSTSTIRASGSPGTSPSPAKRLEVRAVVRRGTASASSAIRSGVASSREIHSGRRLVCTRWSGHGAPTFTSRAACSEQTNSITRSDVSTVSTFARSLDTAPRIAGSSSVSDPAGLGLAPAEARHVARARVDERDGLVDDLDRLAVGLLGGLAPDDQAVLGQHDELEVRVVADREADLLGQREARADVRESTRPRRRSTPGSAARRRPCPASTLMPSGCVWCTCGAGTNACSSVSIDGARHRRGRAGSGRGRRPCPRRTSRRAPAAAASRPAAAPVKCSGPIVARSEPEPLTHIARPRGRRGRSSCPWPTCCRRRSSTPRGWRRADATPAPAGPSVVLRRLVWPEILDMVDDRGHGAHRVSSCSVSRSEAIRAA